VNTPTLTETLRRVLSARLLAVNTSIPARVETFDRATQTISAQPLVRMSYRDETGARRTEALPIVTSVPVVYFGAGDYSDTFPLTKGDTVLLMFAQSSLDKWLDRGGLVDPADDRRFSLTDGIAIPGLRSRRDALDDDATASDARVLSGPEIRIGGASGTEPTIMGETFLDALDTLLTAVSSAIGAVTGGGAGTAIFDPAKATFDAAVATYKSTIAKVK